MATITPRRKKDGSIVYTAQIRMRVDGLKHSESRSSGDKAFLVRWVAKRETELREPGAIARELHAGVTVGDVLYWYVQDFSRNIAFGRTKLSHIKFLIGHDVSQLDAVRLTPSQLIAHAHSRAACGAGPSTINNDFIWLRNAMRSVRLSRDVPANIQAVDDAAALLRSERVIAKSSQRTRRPTLDELGRLLAYFAVQDKRSKVKMLPVVLFALFSSRRQGEVCSIRWEDVDRRLRGVLVRDMKHPRDRIDTFCFFTDEAWAIIESLPGDRVGVIFPFKSQSIKSRFLFACRFLGIDDLRFHDLRHECVSWLFELGLDAPRVSSISGHKSWSSLQRYTHISRRETFDKYADWRWRPR